MPRRDPESQAAANEHDRQRHRGLDATERKVAAEGRRLAELLADEMSEEVLMRRCCEKRGRSVLAVKAERDRVLRSPR